MNNQKVGPYARALESDARSVLRINERNLLKWKIERWTLDLELRERNSLEHKDKCENER